MLISKELILKGRLRGEANSWSHPGATPHTSNMAKFCLQPHPGNLISFIRLAMALSGWRMSPRGSHSFLAGAHHLRNWALQGLGLRGSRRFLWNYIREHWWSLEHPYILCGGITYFIKKYRSEVECEQERFQLGEASLAIQGAALLLRSSPAS